DRAPLGPLLLRRLARSSPARIRLRGRTRLRSTRQCANQTRARHQPSLPRRKARSTAVMDKAQHRQAMVNLASGDSRLRDQADTRPEGSERSRELVRAELIRESAPKK